MKEIIYCYTCENWVSTSWWKGKCPKHPERGAKYNTDATINGCPDYKDKYEKYLVAAKGGINDNRNS